MWTFWQEHIYSVWNSTNVVAKINFKNTTEFPPFHVFWAVVGSCGLKPVSTCHKLQFNCYVRHIKVNKQPLTSTEFLPVCACALQQKLSFNPKPAKRNWNICACEGEEKYFTCERCKMQSGCVVLFLVL